MSQFKTLLIAVICLTLSACFEQGQTAQVSLAPITGAPGTPEEPIEPPVEEPVEPPAPWSAPTNATEAEQEFRGLYTEVSKATNTLEVDGAANMNGSRVTPYTYQVSGQTITANTTCWWNSHSVRAEARADGRYNVYITISSASHNADTTVKDCMKSPTQAGVTEVALFVRFIDELCVGLEFMASTGEKIYCKE